MTGTEHMKRCKIDALLSRAEQVLQRSLSLRLRTNDARAFREALLEGRIPTCGAYHRAADRPATHLVAIVFSAGGLQPLIQLLHALDREFPAAIAVAHHVGSTSCVPDLLRNQTALPVKFAEDGEALHTGTVYVCPPLRHLIINPDARVSLSPHPRVHNARPSADWFFRSVAGSFDSRALAVVLSGASSDGAEGVARVFDAGGQIFVQDPRTCAFPTMTEAALHTGRSCGIHAPGEMGAALTAAMGLLDISGAQAEWEQPFGPLAA